MSPKAHFTELTVAIFKERGVDPKNIQGVRIMNDSTRQTIDSIVKSPRISMGN